MKKIQRLTLIFTATFSSVALTTSNANQSLLTAVRAENVRGVTRALNNHADPDYAPNNGITPLMDAAESGNLTIVNKLIAAKANVNKQDLNKEETPLMRAARYGHLEVINALLKAGANLKITDKKGLTAYDHAIKNGFPNCAAVLMPPDLDAR